MENLENKIGEIGKLSIKEAVWEAVFTGMAAGSALATYALYSDVIRPGNFSAYKHAKEISYALTAEMAAIAIGFGLLAYINGKFMLNTKK